MAARIIIVHDDPDFVLMAEAELALGGHRVMSFFNPIEALNEIDIVSRLDLLITCIEFSAGRPNGISVALMARRRHAAVEILFTAQPEFRQAAEDIGTFLTLPVTQQEFGATVAPLLAASGVNQRIGPL